MDLRVPGIVLVALFLGQGLAGIPQASAQDDLGAAKAHYNKASRLYDVGEYRQALEEFKAAHLAKPDPAFLFNIAQCHRQLGDLEQAIVMYKRFLAASPKAGNRSEVSDEEYPFA
jgi:tetratricopeptide (TPR) repeat protein